MTKSTPGVDSTRRSVLGTVVAGVTCGVAGCLGSSETVPDARSLDGEQHHCDECNMIIHNHPGPVGQSFYLDDAPQSIDDREDGIAWFCSTLCLYQFASDADRRGFEPVGSYGTDYSAVNYELRENGTTAISEHVNADAFVSTTDLTYVVDSDVYGAMGSSLIGFSNDDDATAFAETHGGELFEEDEITDELLAALSS